MFVVLVLFSCLVGCGFFLFVHFLFFGWFGFVHFVVAPSLEIFKTRLDVALGNLI